MAATVDAYFSYVGNDNASFRLLFENDLTASDEVRDRLELAPHVPVVACEATDKDSVKSVLLALLYSVLDEIEAEAAHA